jgi:ribosomal protein RSM22 (predicted rRNA methylase)
MLFPLPDALQKALHAETSRFPAAQLKRDSATLTAGYKQTGAAPRITSDSQRAAYLLTRLPATYAAICAVLRELKTRRPDFAPVSLLDLGSGPGTVLWAVNEFYQSVTRADMLERDDSFRRTGQRLAALGKLAANWQQHDLLDAKPLPASDLVTTSYALNELPEAAQQSLIRRAWAAAREVFAVIEPGTKAGFANILRARRELLESGARLLAPCPHSSACPLAETDDWCHFAQRLPRAAAHRLGKSATLGYEDEKFAYLVASRTPAQPAPARILRHPFYGKGHVKLSLCAAEGLRRETLTAKDKEMYKLARKASWGDVWRS